QGAVGEVDRVGGGNRAATPVPVGVVLLLVDAPEHLTLVHDLEEVWVAVPVVRGYRPVQERERVAVRTSDDRLLLEDQRSTCHTCATGPLSVEIIRARGNRRARGPSYPFVGSCRIRRPGHC